MVVRHCVDSCEQAHVVLVWHIVPVVSHNIEWGVLERRLIELAQELRDQLEVTFLLLVAGFGRQEMPRMREAPRDADGPEVRAHKEATEILQKVTSRRPLAAWRVVDLEDLALLDQGY